MELKSFIYLFRAKNTIENVLTKFLKQYEITLTEYGILEYLYHKGSSAVNLVCEKVLVQNSAMTYISNKLTEKGLVKRQSDKVDRRRVILSITPKGLKLVESIIPHHDALIKELFSVLSVSQITELSQSLKKLGLNAKGYEDEL